MGRDKPSQKRTRKCDKLPSKTPPEFYDELVKMLKQDYQLCLIHEHKNAKERAYWSAAQYAEHASVIKWLLQEIDCYRRNGRWM